jgi:hypothetical protein
MSGAIPHYPNTPSWRGAHLKHRDNFTFIFCIPFFPNFLQQFIKIFCTYFVDRGDFNPFPLVAGTFLLRKILEITVRNIIRAT